MCGKNVKFNFSKLRPAVVWAISPKCQPSPTHTPPPLPSPQQLSNFGISFEVHLGNYMVPQNKSFTISQYKQVLCRSYLLSCTVVYVNFRDFKAKSNCACAVLEFAWNQQLCKYLFIRHQIDATAFNPRVLHLVHGKWSVLCKKRSTAYTIMNVSLRVILRSRFSALSYRLTFWFNREMMIG